LDGVDLHHMPPKMEVFLLLVPSVCHLGLPNLLSLNLVHQVLLRLRVVFLPLHGSVEQCCCIYLVLEGCLLKGLGLLAMTLVDNISTFYFFMTSSIHSLQGRLRLLLSQALEHLSLASPRFSGGYLVPYQVVYTQQWLWHGSPL
jgi:hypothetical protein